MYGAFWAFWELLGVLCVWGGAGFAGFSPHVCRTRVTKVCYRWTRPLGGGRWEHFLLDPRGVHCFSQKSASCYHGDGSDSIVAMLYVSALAGLPSLLGYDAGVVFWVKESSWRNCRKLCETSFSPFRVFSV